MKVGSDADYVLRIREESWDVRNELIPLYKGIYTFDLNQVVHVIFLPRVTAAGPPWSTDGLPRDAADFTTQEHARLLDVLTTQYSVTPDNERAGTVQQLDWPFPWPPENISVSPRDYSPPIQTVFFVTTDEFNRLSADLEDLTEIAGDIHSMVRHSEVADHKAVRFVDERILDSPWLQPEHAASIGRTG
jgi:hypothetical protein